jgi:hypothetical protein
MERILIQRYDVDVKSKVKLEELMEDIDDWEQYLEPATNFYYEPKEVMGKLDIQTSICFDNDIEDEKSLTKNVLDFIKS